VLLGLDKILFAFNANQQCLPCLCTSPAAHCLVGSSHLCRIPRLELGRRSLAGLAVQTSSCQEVAAEWHGLEASSLPTAGTRSIPAA
jgi:hypothetical protein